MERNAILEQSRGLDKVAARLIFAATSSSNAMSFPIRLKKRGVIFQPLERAMVEHADYSKIFHVAAARSWLGEIRALHQALVSSGTFLYVPRGVEIELPIEIFHWLHGENASVFPHLLLVTDELAKVIVIEHFRSLDRKRRDLPAESTI
jgi:Fe-S cluster assembly protein SufD